MPGSSEQQEYSLGMESSFLVTGTNTELLLHLQVETVLLSTGESRNISKTIPFQNIVCQALVRWMFYGIVRPNGLGLLRKEGLSELARAVLSF